MKMAFRSSRQRGVVLVTSLLILVVMLIAAVALVRSFDTSLSTAGNLAFKRDVAQQSERVAQDVIAEFRAGGWLADRANRGVNSPARNYSASVLESNAQGIPLALLEAALPPAVGTVADITTANGVVLRYTVDRQCTQAGDENALGTTFCTTADDDPNPGGSSSQWLRAEQGSAVAAGGAGAGLAGAQPQPVVYRISVRATGPRGTQSFFQTTFACCDN